MDRSNVLYDFMLAGASSSVGKTIVAPLERVKLLLQLQDASSQLTKDQRYTGIRNCFYRVYREQGFLSLWRGNLANVLRYFPTQASSFALKDFFKRHVREYDMEKEYHKFLLRNMVAGGFAGGVTTLIAYPLDFSRTRLSADVGKAKIDREFLGITDILVKVWKSEGIKGYYRGISVALPGFIIYRAFYFGLYDTLKLSLPENSSIVLKFLLAQSITTTVGLTIYPTDTIRRRMMMQTVRKDKLYTGIIDCVKKIYLEKGLKSFYKGGLTNVMRSAGGALVLVFYDKLKDWLTI